MCVQIIVLMKLLIISQKKMNLQHFSNIDLADSKTTISNITKTPVKCKIALMVKQLNKYLCFLEIDTVDNNKICIGSSGKKVASTSVKFQ